MKRITLCLLMSIVTPTIFWGITPEESASTLGILTLIPPVLSIVLAFVTRKVYFSLALGIWSGAILLAVAKGFEFADIYHSFEKVVTVIISVLSDSWSASIIAQIVTISGLIAIIGKNGGAYAIAEAIAKKAKTARSAQIFTCMTALCIFFDDYANCLVTGPVMKPVTDKLKVSREKLAFLVDATAAPIAGIALISTWIGYELSVIRDAYIAAGVPDPQSYIIFIKTLPYRFYNFFMLGFLMIIAILNRDFGPMLKAEQRARQKGQPSPHTDINCIEDNTLKPNLGITYKISNALIPILVLIFGAFFGIWYEGYRNLITEGVNISVMSAYDYTLAILGATDVIVVILKSSILASIVAMILSALTKTMTFFESIDIWIIGAKGMMETVLVLLFAWSISAIIKELGTSLYLIQVLQNNIPIVLIPTITFILASCVAFATGTSYGTMGILMPLAVPLATTLSGSPDSNITMVTVGTVLTGAIVGDHCSPISDTTVLSAGGSSCPLIEHVDTQLPYVLLVVVVTILFGYLLVAFNVPVLLSYIIGFIVLTVTVLLIGKKPDIEPYVE